MNTEILLNDFAIRCFRDVGDYDYIAARMAYRAKLVPQFLWSGLQAIEKYLKCILLLNRIKAKHLRHNLGDALRLVESHAPYELRLQEPSRKLIAHLDTYGRFRYLERPFHVMGLEIVQLDKAVWEMRRYCKYSVTLLGAGKELFELELQKIVNSEKRPPQHLKIVGGALEKVLANRQHPAREALIWQNLFFGSRARKKVRLGRYMHATNPPLSLHPEILDDVLQYVFLPKDIVAAYRKELTRRATRAI